MKNREGKATYFTQKYKNNLLAETVKKVYTPACYWKAIAEAYLSGVSDKLTIYGQ